MNNKTIYSAVYASIACIFMALILTDCSTSATTTLTNYIPFSKTAALPTGQNWENDSTLWNNSPATVWTSLQQVTKPKLLAATTSDPSKRAWIELAVISKQYSLDTSTLVQHLITWRKQYPNHPGNQLFPADAALLALDTSNVPKSITLLLPLQGAAQRSGSAVRDGFLSAYYEHLNRTHNQQTISFVNTSNAAPVSNLYQDAVSKGANFIVGPLLKNDVLSLAGYNNFTVPTLALNFTERSSPVNFYQFGLSPTDEAKQMADRAFVKGLRHVLFIYPDNAWGHKVASELTSRWGQLGGSIQDTLAFTPQMNLSNSIAALLHVDPAVDRSKNKTDNDKDELQDQRRKDFDGIFLLADPKNARQIIPLLHFYYVNNIPIYSTSIVYSGIPNATHDTDLNGVNFCDLPWTLDLAHSQTASAGDNRFNRLYAVGRDAYLISAEYQRFTLLPNFPVYGSTGALSLNGSQIFDRRLPWAQFTNGRP